jgi:hypothetical protein
MRQVAPRPAIHDAETTKLVHVDFTEPDLPWRYTPRPLVGDRVRPWLVVLVGVSEELQVASGVVTSVEPAVLAAHRLELSYRWAHVQDDGQSTLGRLLSPAVLLPQRDYTAAIVPAFDPQGHDAWTDQGVSAGFPGGLPVYYSWQFATGEAGDFETLASALQMRQAGDLGKARLHYRRPDVTGIDVTLEARGAITSLQAPLDEANLAALDDTEVLGLLHSYRQRLGGLDPAGLTPAEQRVKLAEVQEQVRAELAAARADLDLLSADVADPPALDGTPPRDLLGLPQYGRPWAPEPEETVWGKTMIDDPSFRVGAGLGAWMSMQAQE